MLQFLNGSLVVVDGESVLPGYLAALQPNVYLEDAGFDSCESYGKGNFTISVTVWRKIAHQSEETLFSVDLNSQPLQEIYCADSLSALNCLIYLSPVFSAAALSGLIDELESAAEYRDLVLSVGAGKAGSLGSVAGLLAAMAGVNPKE